MGVAALVLSGLRFEKAIATRAMTTTAPPAKEKCLALLYRAAGFLASATTNLQVGNNGLNAYEEERDRANRDQRPPGDEITLELNNGLDENGDEYAEKSAENVTFATG